MSAWGNTVEFHKIHHLGIVIFWGNQVKDKQGKAVVIHSRRAILRGCASWKRVLGRGSSWQHLQLVECVSVIHIGSGPDNSWNDQSMRDAYAVTKNAQHCGEESTATWLDQELDGDSIQTACNCRYSQTKWVMNCSLVLLTDDITDRTTRSCIPIERRLGNNRTHLREKMQRN